MKEQLKINVIGHGEFLVDRNSSILDLVKRLGMNDVMAAKIDNEFLNLNTGFDKNCDVEFVRISDKAGHRMYVAGLKFMLIVAIHEIYGRDATLYVHHSIDKGTYCEADINKKLTDADIEKIKTRMLEYVDRDLPFEKISADKGSAVKYFKKTKEFEKAENADETINDNVTLYKLFDYYNYFYVALPVSTGCLKRFDLLRINESGFILQYPEKENPKVIPAYNHYTKILDSFDSYREWLDLLDCEYVSDLNNIVAEGKIEEFIRMNEIRFNNQIMNIVNHVSKNKDDIKILLLGGPSSSGKTTSSKKLSLYLKAAGFNPLVLSVDDYYKDRVDCPKDEEGNYDFECLEALDLKLFNSHLSKLINGISVCPPHFNFFTGKKEFNENERIKLGTNGIIVIEGLHCINEELTKSIDPKHKYKIYISPFNSLTIDRHNHVSTVDMRLLRRMVRDYLFRGYSPEYTLSTWRVVRDGEKKYLFPCMDQADVVLNTCMAYEIGVLKVYAEPLLYSIKPTSKYYDESRRILKFMTSFFNISPEFVPNDSIIREFIGGSYFNKE